MYNEKEYWNKRLETYGSVNTSKEDCINPAERELIIKYVNKSDLIMDYGVGGGRMFPVYNEVGCSVQGVDVADFRELIDKKLETNKDFKYYHYIMEKDLANLEYPDNNFKWIVSFAVLMHIRPENIEKTVNEMKRISERLIISSYNGKPLADFPDQHCFLHNYDELFKDCKIIETFKIRDGQFWVLDVQK